MKKLFLLIVVVATSWTQSVSQNIQVDDNGAVNQEIEKALDQGVAFASCALIKAVASADENQRQKIELGENGLLFARSVQPTYMEVELPIEGETYTLLLKENDIFADGFRVSTSSGEELGKDTELGVHYRGVVKGQSSSLVALSVYGDEISGFVKGNEDMWLIRSAVNATGDLENFMFEYEDQDASLSCFTQDDGYVYTEDELQLRLSTRNSTPVGIYLEVDNDIYKDKRQGTSSYATGLFNESATLYSNDGVTIQLSELLIWDQRSPYRGNDASRLLSSFQSYWGSGGSWNGDLAHLIAYRGSGGIAAGFNGLCNGDRRASMCFSGVDPSYAPVPTYSWSVMVFTHEMGHLMGSRHTHACVWNGNGTAIDGCYTTEGSCPRPGIPENGGTIMSYCHLTSAGINFNNGFGDQPKAVIQNSVAGASCLGGGGTGTNHCTNGIQDADEEGIDCGGVDCAPCPTGSCDVPGGLVADNIKGNRVRMNWDAVTGAISYDVQIREAGGSYTAGNTFNTSSNNLNLRGLSNGTTYEWRVRTNCAAESSAYSSDCSFVAGDKNSGACGTTLERGAAEYSVYPNPAISQITVLGLPFDGQTDISIYDLSGKKVLVRSNVNSGTIDVSDLQRGLYFIQINTTENTTSLKFQLQ